jgi:DNA-binding SARP family transcriptional activator
MLPGRVGTFRILGPLEVAVAGRSADLGPRQSLVLATLLLHANQPVSVERLAHAVWEKPTAAAPSHVRTYVASLRRIRGTERVVQIRSTGGYVLVAGPDELDFGIFRDCLAKGTAAYRVGDAEKAVALLDLSVRLWRGRPLEGLRLASPLRLECERLDELRAVAAKSLVHARLLAGDLIGLPEYARTWVDRHPYREDFWGLYMLALYRSGRAFEALAAYRQVSELLRTGAGLDPGRQLQDLHERILRRDPRLDDGDIGTVARFSSCGGWLS